MRISNNDPADVMFAKSTDGGLSWSNPIRINNDPGISRYQWFGTMSVAPSGRIDIIWLDNRDAPAGSYKSALYYCYSDDQGVTWSINKKLSGLFDPRIGWPQQHKMGDYFDMESDDAGAHLAWANTLNGGQDVYYTHIIPTIVGMEEASGNPDLLSVTSYPNPCRDHATIQYQIPGNQPVRLVICNIYGEEMNVVIDKNQHAGTYTVDINTDLLPAGFYFCRLTSGTLMTTARMIKVK
jgi:hypothetical protein